MSEAMQLFGNISLGSRGAVVSGARGAVCMSPCCCPIALLHHLPMLAESRANAARSRRIYMAPPARRQDDRCEEGRQVIITCRLLHKHRARQGDERMHPA
jgi:hypothetical protein